jgi:hypothetical protein
MDLLMNLGYCYCDATQDSEQFKYLEFRKHLNGINVDEIRDIITESLKGMMNQQYSKKKTNAKNTITNFFIEDNDPDIDDPFIVFIETIKVIFSNDNVHITQNQKNELVKNIIETAWEHHDIIGRTIFGNIISLARESGLQENFYNNIIVSILTKIIDGTKFTTNAAIENRADIIKNWFDSLERFTNDPYRDIYQYLEKFDFLNAPRTELDTVTLKIILRNIIETYADHHVRDRALLFEEVNLIEHIDDLIIRIKCDYDRIFEGDFPFERKFLRNQHNSIFSALNTLGKMAVIGCPKTIMNMLVEVRKDEDIGTITELFNVALRYKNYKCAEQLNECLKYLSGDINDMDHINGRTFASELLYVLVKISQNCYYM